MDKSSVIDEAGLRANVGLIVSNNRGEVLWARRRNNSQAWQFPQGGIQKGETPEEAMYRELYEELGLQASDVRCLASTQQWHSYWLPEQYIRRQVKPLCIGQKQKWFLLRLLSDESRVRLDEHEKPEFDIWRWVDYWYPLTEVVAFKREVYQAAMTELKVYL